MCSAVLRYEAYGTMTVLALTVLVLFPAWPQFFLSVFMDCHLLWQALNWRKLIILGNGCAHEVHAWGAHQHGIDAGGRNVVSCKQMRGLTCCVFPHNPPSNGRTDLVQQQVA